MYVIYPRCYEVEPSPGGGGGTQVLRGPRYVFRVRRGLFLRPPHVRDFVNEGYFFVPRYEVWGSKSPYNPRNIRDAFTILMALTMLVRELTFETLPPLGNFGDLYFQKPYTLSCLDQLVCTYIAGAFALEGQLKVGTSLILGVGVTFSKWGWYGHLQLSGILQICCAGQVINRNNYQIPFRSTVLLSMEKKFKNVSKNAIFLQFF